MWSIAKGHLRISETSETTRFLADGPPAGGSAPSVEGRHLAAREGDPGVRTSG